MNVRCIASLAEFQSLRDSWSQLVQADRGASVFQSWEWQFFWWKYYGDGKRLYILAAWDNEILFGLRPLYSCLEPVMPGRAIRSLRLIGTGGDTSPDYLGAVLRDGHGEAASKALLSYLAEHQKEWDSLQLTDIADGSVFLAEVRAWRGDTNWQWQDAISQRISFLSLPGTWDDYLASLSRERRYAVRNTRKKFLALAGARFFRWDTQDDLDRAFDNLSRLHHARWNTKGEDHSFSSEQYNGFHREVMRECGRNGWLRLYCMELQGQIIAMYYCYAWGGTTYYFQGGFDPAQEKLRPGLCLMGFAIEQAIQEGQQCFDMLRGEYEYKKQWAKEVRCTQRRSCERPGFDATLYRIRKQVVPQIRRRLKSLLRRT